MSYVSNKVLCRLCTCEGVKDTLLCRDHLEGFIYACRLLSATNHRDFANALQGAIAQKAPTTQSEPVKPACTQCLPGMKCSLHGGITMYLPGDKPQEE